MKKVRDGFSVLIRRNRPHNLMSEVFLNIKNILEEINNETIPDEIIKDLQRRLLLLEPLVKKLSIDFERNLYPVFHIVEFGCGYDTLVFLLVQSLAKIFNIEIYYLGIDIDQYAIDICLNLHQSLPENMRVNSKFIVANAAEKIWLEQHHNKKFNVAVFINPIVEDPYEAVKGFNSSFFTKKERKERDERFDNIKIQYQQFMQVFKSILPMCLEDNSTLFFKTFYPEELKALKKILIDLNIESMDEDLDRQSLLIDYALPTLSLQLGQVITYKESSRISGGRVTVTAYPTRSQPVCLIG